MRQLTFVEADRLERWDVDEPRLTGHREALVHPLAVSTCDLDAAIVHGRAPVEGPFPLGHEGVAQRRPGRRRCRLPAWRPGDRALPDLLRRVRTVPVAAEGLGDHTSKVVVAASVRVSA
jgi:hypothetical protein